MINAVILRERSPIGGVILSSLTCSGSKLRSKNDTCKPIDLLSHEERTEPKRFSV